MENICGAGHSDRIDFFTATPHSGIRTDDHVKSHFNGGFHLSGVDDTAYAEDHGVVRVFPETGFSHFQQIGHCFLKDFFWNTEGNLGNQGDFSDALGYETAAEKGVPFEEWLDAYADMLRVVAKDYQNLKLIGTQLRAPHSADRISWTAVLYDTQADQIHQATLRENIEITDRTGGGDSFASAVIAAIMEGKGYDEAVEWGAAHGILVQETPGDTTMVSKKMVLSEVARAKKGGGVSALR